MYLSLTILSFLILSPPVFFILMSHPFYGKDFTSIHLLQCIGTVDKTKPDELSTQVANGIQHPQVTQGSSFLSGMKQRLLSFIFRKTWNEEADQTLVGCINTFCLVIRFIHTKFFYFLNCTL